MTLPPAFQDWFARQGWTPHPHQLDLLAATGDTLLIAPTGGGKTLAGFLPSLVELADGWQGLHTLYVSPLKALTADIGRNLARPVADLGLPIRVEDRTGDTTQPARQRQRTDPPQILLTTPESLALMLSYPEAPRIFGGLRRVVLDELHALAKSKRGDQLMLGLARLRRWRRGWPRPAFGARSRTPTRWPRFMGRRCGHQRRSRPRSRHRHAAHRRRRALGRAATGIMRCPRCWPRSGAQTRPSFSSTPARRRNCTSRSCGPPTTTTCPSACITAACRARPPAGRSRDGCRGIARRGRTGSLDLGIDWGGVDLVIQVGAPKNVKRLVQRIGRANHRYNAPSKARIVPANRFEVIECVAALQAVRERDLDGDARGPGPLDVLCQHILLTACAGPFDADALFRRGARRRTLRDAEPGGLRRLCRVLRDRRLCAARL